MSDWPIEKKKLSELTPAEYNPRTMTEKAKSGLEKSVDRFGFVEPIVWNKRTGNIVGGHQRYKVLVSKGVEETDVVVVDLDKDEEIALNITLNSPNVRGEWTDDVGDLLRTIGEELGDVFEELCLTELVGDWEVDKDQELPPDIDERFLTESTENKEFENMEIGEHKILLGDDSTDIELGDLVFLFGGCDDFDKLSDNTRDGCVCYGFCNNFREMLKMKKNLEKMGWSVIQLLQWLHRGSYNLGEALPILYAVKEGGHYFSDSQKLGEVLEFTSYGSGRISLKLILSLMVASSKENDSVLVFGADKGTVLVASEMLKRKCTMFAQDMVLASQAVHWLKQVLEI